MEMKQKEKDGKGGGKWVGFEYTLFLVWMRGKE
jgi:hypothetical protein